MFKFISACLFALAIAQPAMAAVPSNPTVDARQQEAVAIAEAWKNEGLFSTPVKVNISPINPNSEAASMQHETFFERGDCHIVVYVDQENGTPTLPGIGPLTKQEYTFAFEMVVMHELSHCAHFARGMRYENPAWDMKHNRTLNEQLVMAQQLYNETRFVDAQMEHVADAYAAVRIRLRYNDNDEINTFLGKYKHLRDHWLNIAASRSGKDVYIQHATQDALQWGRTVPMSMHSTPLEWFNHAVQVSSQTALDTAKRQVAWGGLGALTCATFSSNAEWSSTASSVLARIAANDISFLPPGPWRELPLDFKDASAMESNNEVFMKTRAVTALSDLEELRAFMTQNGKDPIPLDSDHVGRPAGVIPMEIAVGASVIHGKEKTRQANGCVAVNPKH